MKTRSRVSKDLGFLSLENPLGGCLFIETTATLNFFLFVFRRRGGAGFNRSDNSERNFPQFAPPKNKKEVIFGGMHSYKQATPNGVSRRISNARIHSPRFLDWS